MPAHRLIAGTLHLTAITRIMQKPSRKKPTRHPSITLPADLAEWVTLHAKLQNVTVRQLVIEAIRYYQQAGTGDRSQITKAISEGTPKVKTGRYEG